MTNSRNIIQSIKVDNILKKSKGGSTENLK